MGLLGPVVEPSSDLSTTCVADLFHSGAVGPQAVRYDDAWITVTLHRSLDEFEGSGLVPGLAGEGSQDLALMIHGAPDVMHFAIDPHVNFVEMPAPMHMGTHVINPFTPNFGREYRAKPVPPKPDSFVADIDPSFGQKVFDVAKRQRVLNVHHDHEADHLG